MAHNCLSFDASDPACSGAVALLVIGTILTVVTIFNYVQLALRDKQSDRCLHPRVQILNLRLALIVPMFSVIALFSLAFPVATFVLEAFEALVEGCCLYCFYRMLSISAGGDAETVTAIANYGTGHVDLATVICCWAYPCINHIQSKYPLALLKIIKWSIFQFFAVRPIFVLIAGIFEQRTGSRFNHITLIFIALYIASLILALASLLRFYHFTQAITVGLKPVLKIVFVKGIIAVIIIQNIVVAQAFTDGYVGITVHTKNLSFVAILVAI